MKKQKKSSPTAQTEDQSESVVEKLIEPDQEPQPDLYWKSYQLFFASGNTSGKRFGFLILPSSCPLDNINRTMLAACNVKAMDLRAPEDIVCKNNVDNPA